MSKGRVFLRIIAGGYLAYTGAGLLKDVLSEKPEHYIVFAAAGILFVVFGLWCMIMGLKAAVKHEYDDPDGIDYADDTDTMSDREDAEEEISGIEEKENEQTTKEED